MAEEVEKKEESSNVKVMTRVRLFNRREMDLSAKKKELLRSVVKMRDKTCAIVEFVEDDFGFPIEKEREAFQFDECFWSMPMEQQPSAMPYADQQYVYEKSGLIAMESALQGFNCTIFAYGQTGSGKTYSMLGCPEDPGISPKMVDDLFKDDATRPMVKRIVECMFFEIYNEKVRDLYNKKSKAGEYDPPKIRQHPTKGVFVEGLQRKTCTGADQTKTLMEKGSKERAQAETKMNAHSSRSHAVFQIQVTQNDAMKGSRTQSTINLVDLAGSEKIKMSMVTGDALTEAKNINQSLSTLRKVIDVLIENSGIKNKKHHKLPPFRESVLTYVLSDSLGGNSKTQMIATISPHEANIEDSIGTLRYALKAKAIVCNAKVNEEKSAAMMEAMKDELLLLQQKLREGGGKGEISEEIKQQIEEREKEMQEMETQQHEMEDMLEVAKQKEVEMEEKLKEVDEAKQELSVAVTLQKKERFAAAFRNAFRITSETKKAAQSQAEVDSLLLVKKELESRCAFLDNELLAQKKQHEDFKRTVDQKMDQMVKDLNARDTTIIQVKREVANYKAEVNQLNAQNEAMHQRVTTMESGKHELERRVQRLQEELLAANATITRQQCEMDATQASFEQKLAVSREENDNLRKRKDKYKQMYLEAYAKAEARSTVVEALKGDRESFLTTIKAQQHVVEEQSESVRRILADRKDVEDKTKTLERKVNEKDEDIRCIGEALREYESAAAEWVYENHSMSRELERVKRNYQDVLQEASIHSSPLGRGQSPLVGTAHYDPGSYRRNPSSISIGSGSPKAGTPFRAL